ncbi:MAG: HlyC/CorC family transporter [Alphaproteobacteria bacterium]|nr:HlyC/CorC family transporter [Alphaproteobacteria bacterium]
MYEILIILLLIFLNAFLALAEIAIIASSQPLLRQYAKQGKKSAASALKLIGNSGRFLSTVQVGITLVSIFAGAYGGATIANKLTEPFNQISFIYPYGAVVAVFVVVTVITYFSVVVGELVPKQLALNNPERFAMFAAWPMWALSKLCTPIVIVLEISAKILMYILRIKPKPQGVTEMEIRAVIADGVTSGAIENEEHNVIRRVIRLGDRDVKSIMTHRKDVCFVHVNDNLDEVAQKIAKFGHSRYPVIEEDTSHVLGIIKTKDIIAQNPGKHHFQVKNFLKQPLFIHEQTTCLDALKIFRNKRLQFAVVVDNDGVLEGIFTISDLMEAIVGVIPANYDAQDDAQIVVRPDGSWLVNGLTPIDEIHLTIGLEDIILTNEYQTMAGFMLSQLKFGPATGKYFEINGYKFEIVDMDGQRIDKILISPFKK